MIKAVIFDLDGTLVQTEILKAGSYAQAMHQISHGQVTESEVEAAFKDLVGLSRAEVAGNLVQQHLQHLIPDAFPDMEAAVRELISLRLDIYAQMTSDPAVLPKYSCEFNIGLLNTSRQLKMKTGLATMSHQVQVEKVLNILQLQDHFDRIITRDMIQNGKPDPEIYLKMVEQLQVQPQEAIIIEDSVSGIKAAMNAGIQVFAVTNRLTRFSVNSSNMLDPQFIINDVKELNLRVMDFIKSKAA
ncbi:MAG: HAD family phosphatase [Bacteroidales bacterium]|nr:HAD family phosphatase [Bacteroidales bacterium]